MSLGVNMWVGAVLILIWLGILIPVLVSKQETICGAISRHIVAEPGTSRDAE
jgi:hypothetical protein